MEPDRPLRTIRGQHGAPCGERAKHGLLVECTAEPLRNFGGACFSFPNSGNAAEIVGQTPWSARDAGPDRRHPLQNRPAT